MNNAPPNAPPRAPFSEREIQSYLRFGAPYGELETGAAAFLDGCDPAPLAEWAAGASREQLVREGVQRLRTATVESLDAAGSGPHALQLSGGYDSRTLLGALREHLGASELTTLTFGTPGSPDYEIARRLAKATGVSHVQLDATEMDWSAPAVTAYARSAFTRLPAALILERYVNYTLRMAVGTEPTYWVGLLGDVLGGAHLPDRPSSSWAGAVERFLRFNRRARSVDLPRPGWTPEGLFPQRPLRDPSGVSLDDQLDLAARQAFYIAVPWRSFTDQYLFDRPVWKDFMLALPWHERAGGMALYLDVMTRAFPKLSRFPVQGGRRPPARRELSRNLFARIGRRGLRIARRLAPGSGAPDVMRIDYAEHLRRDEPLSAFVHALLDALDRGGRVRHVNVERLWDEHRERHADHSAALMTLAGLQLNVDAAGSPRAGDARARPLT